MHQQHFNTSDMWFLTRLLARGIFFSTNFIEKDKHRDIRNSEQIGEHIYSARGSTETTDESKHNVKQVVKEIQILYFIHVLNFIKCIFFHYTILNLEHRFAVITAFLLQELDKVSM